jgi:hypothetical protein
MIPTHAFSINGSTWMELQDSFGPPSQEIHDLLHRLDGTDRYSMILWGLPPGKDLDQVLPDKEAREYIQSAGSADRMTVEIRRIVDGVPEQLVVGRSIDSAQTEPSIDVPWNGYTNTVRANEVFHAGEAAKLFQSYYESGQLPPGYSVRKIDL